MCSEGMLSIHMGSSLCFAKRGDSEITDLACQTAGWWWLQFQRARLALVGVPCMPPPPTHNNDNNDDDNNNNNKDSNNNNHNNINNNNNSTNTNIHNNTYLQACHACFHHL